MRDGGIRGARRYEWSTMSKDRASSSSSGAGWYFTPSGEQRFWDGEKWLDLPAPEPVGKPRSKRSRWPLIVAALIVVAGLAGGLLLLKSVRAEREATQQLVAELQEQQQVEEDERVKAEQDEQDEANRQQEKDQREIDRRKKAVERIEADVAEMAEEHIADGLIEGEVLYVTCTPVAGGSVEDLMDKTGTLECFVATEKVDAQRDRGYDYHATMNWDTGQYTYGFGKP